MLLAIRFLHLRKKIDLSNALFQKWFQKLLLITYQTNKYVTNCCADDSLLLLFMRFHNGLSLRGWLRKLSIQYLQNIPQGKRKIQPLTVKSNSWPSRGGTVWNKQENEQKARNWRLQTSAPGRMSSVALPGVILGEGKSLISKPGQTGLLSHGRQPVQ